MMALGLDFKKCYTIFMNFLKKNLSRISYLFFILILPVISFADDNPLPGSDGKIHNPISVNTLNGFLKIILEGVVKIGIPIIAIAIVYSGFLFVSARGNEKQLETAKKSLLYSIIGAAILLGAWAIATLISDTVLGL